MIQDKRALLAGAAFLAAVGAGEDTAAQTSQRGALATSADTNFARDRNISVRQRPRPDYTAKGLPLGAFRAFPRVSLSAERNDNIYALKTGEVEDTIWRVQPEVNVVSNWSRHSVSAYVRGTINRFQDNDTENTEEFGLGANGRVDILRNTNVTVGADYAHLTEPRTTTQRLTGGGPFTGALEPVEFDQANAYIAGAHEFNRLKVSGRASVQSFDYEDSARLAPLAPIDQDYRDRTVTAASARVDYAVSPDTALFVEATGNQRSYDSSPTTPGFVRRDSDGVMVLGGANFELGALLRGEIALGYMQQEYEAASIGSIEGFGARAEVEWFPSELTTFTATASRTVEDAAVPNSPGFVSSNVGLVLDHELLRNVLISAQLSAGRDEYEGIDREDERVNAGVSATYLLNRNVGLTAAYSYADTKSSGADVGAEFTVNRVSATLTLQF